MGGLDATLPDEFGTDERPRDALRAVTVFS